MENSPFKALLFPRSSNCSVSSVLFALCLLCVLHFTSSDALTSDFYLYNSDPTQANIGSALAQHAGNLAYGQNGGGFLSATQADVQASIGTLTLIDPALAGSVTRVATRNDFALLAGAATVFTYQLNRTSTPISWNSRGNITASLLFPAFSMSGDRLSAANFSRVVAVAVEGSGIPTAVVTFRAAGVISIAILELVPISLCVVPGSCTAVPPNSTQLLAWKQAAVFSPINISAVQPSQAADCGWSVSIAENFIAAGCPTNNSVVLFSRSNSSGTWALNSIVTMLSPSDLALNANASSTSPALITGSEGFGSSVFINQRHLLVGAPQLGQLPLFASPTRVVGTGATLSGSVFVYNSPLRVASVQFAIGSPVIPSSSTALLRLCVLGHPIQSAYFGSSLAADWLYDTTVVLAGAPYINVGVTLWLKEPGSRAGAITNVSCEFRDTIGGFSMHTERDLSTAVSFAGEVSYLGSPSASNANIGPGLPAGRIYTKTYCFPDRYMSLDLTNAYRRFCTPCPAGRFSRGADAGFTSCRNCPVPKPQQAAWVTDSTCAWQCSTGFFGTNCTSCSLYRGSQSALLPANGVWVDGLPACVWSCALGFTRNTSAPTLDQLATFPIDALPVPDYGIIWCLPPPAPTAIMFLQPSLSVLGAGYVGIVFVTPPAPNSAPFLNIAIRVQDVVSLADWIIQVDMIRVVNASSSDTAALATLIANITGNEPNYNISALTVPAIGLSATSAYKFQLAIANAGGLSEFSSWTTVTTTTAATTPSLPGVVFAKNITGGRLVLAWLPPLDSGGLPQLNFTLCYYPPGTSPPAACPAFIVGTNSTSYVLAGLLANTQHRFAVSVCNVLGCSGQTAVSAPIATSGVTVPSVPLDCLASPLSGSQLNVTWTPPVDTGGVLSLSYTVRVAVSTTATSWLYMLRVNTTWFVIDGLAASTTYDIGVRANNAQFSGPFTATIQGTTAPPSPPSRPLNVIASSIRSSSVSLSWLPPASDGGADVLFFTVLAITSNSAASNVTLVAAADSSQLGVFNATLRGLLGSTPYVVSITANNSVGQSLPAVLSQFTTLPAVIPAAPGAPSFISATGGTLTVMWTAPIDDGGSYITSYSVFVSSDYNIFTASGVVAMSTRAATCTFTLPSLAARTTYFVAVMATNSVGSSGYSNTSLPMRTSTASVPATPEALIVGPLLARPWSVATLSWKPFVDTGGLSIIAAQFMFETDDADASTGLLHSRNWTIDAASEDFSSCRTVVAGLLAEQNYTFSMRVQNVLGFSEWSNVSTVYTTAAATLPDAPTAVLVPTATATSVLVVWSPPLDLGGALLTQYTLTLQDSASGVEVVSCNVSAPAMIFPPDPAASLASLQSSCTATGLSSNSSYTAFVYAWNRIGMGQQAASTTCATASLAVPPAPPSGVSVDTTSATSLTVRWALVTNTGGSPVIAYRIYIAPASLALYATTGVSVSQLTAQMIDTASDVNATLITGLFHDTSYAIQLVSMTTAGTSTLSTLVYAQTSSIAPAVTSIEPPGAVSIVASGASSVVVNVTASAAVDQHSIRYLLFALRAPALLPSSAFMTTCAATLSAFTYCIRDSMSGAVCCAVADVDTPSKMIGLAASTQYSVIAYADDGTSISNASSPSALFLTDFIQGPSTPGSPIVLQALSSSVVLAWPASDTGGATSSLVYAINITSISTLTFVTSFTSAFISSLQTGAVSGLTASTVYSACVRTYSLDAAITTSYSNCTTFTTAAARLPRRPTAVTVTGVASDSIAVSWSPPADTGGLPVISYALCWVLLSDQDNTTAAAAVLFASFSNFGLPFPNTTVSAAATSALAFPLLGSASYGIQVLALTAAGISSGSPLIARTSAPQAPGSPRLALHSITSSQAVFAVYPPVSTGGDVITALQLNITTLDSPFTLDNDSATLPVQFVGTDPVLVTVTELFFNSSYSVLAAVANSVGWSASVVCDSSVRTGTGTFPSPPLDVIPTSATASSVLLTWTVPSDSGGAPISDYVISASYNIVDMGIVAIALASNTSGQSYNVTGLYASSRYRFTVVARTVVGDSAASQQSGIMVTSSAVQPLAPTMIAVTNLTAAYADLSWSAPTDFGGQPLVCYRVDVAVDGILTDACNISAYDASVGFWASNQSIGNNGNGYAGLPFQYSLPSHILPNTAQPYTTITCVRSTQFRVLSVPNRILRVLVFAITAPWQANITSLSTTAAAAISSSNPNGLLISPVNVSTLIITPATVPSTPAALTVFTRNTTTVSLGASVPVIDGGCNITSATVLQRLWNTTSLAWASSASVIWYYNNTDVATLTPQFGNFFPIRLIAGPFQRFTRVSFQLLVSNDIGNSNASVLVDVTTLPLLPTPPLSLSLNSDWINPVSVGLVWSAPTDSGGPPITSFRVYYGEAFNCTQSWSSFTPIATISASVFAYNATSMVNLGYSMQPNTSYAFIATTVTAFGESSPSNCVTVITPPPIICPANCSSRGVCASWNGICTCDAGFSSNDCSLLLGFPVTVTTLGTTVSLFNVTAFVYQLAWTLTEPTERFLVIDAPRLLTSSTLQCTVLVLFTSQTVVWSTSAADVIAAWMQLGSTTRAMAALGIVNITYSGSSVIIPSSNCSSSSTCLNCLDSDDCGWCSASSQCTPGTWMSPAVSGSPVCPDITRNYYHLNSSRPVCLPECSTLSQCTSCAARTDCAWCDTTSTCVRAADVVSSVAVCPRSAPITWVTSTATCPINRCRAKLDCASCTTDAMCGWCATSGGCTVGNAFGSLDATSPYCLLGRYDSWRYGAGNCLSPLVPCSRWSSCSSCSSKQGCGWCSSPSASYCAFSTPSADAPLNTTCSGMWVSPITPPCLPSTIEQCAAHDTNCGDCLSSRAIVYALNGTAQSSVACSWCEYPAGSSSRCMPNETSALTACTTSTYSRSCVDRCNLEQPQNRSRSGVLSLGSVRTRFGDNIPRTYPASSDVPCFWYITPTRYSGTVPPQQDEQLPDVTLRLLSMDMAVGDSLELYNDFVETQLVARFDGTGAVGTDFPAVKVSSGQLKVVLRTTSSFALRETRTGFYAVWSASARHVIDIYFVAGVVISTVSVCMCALCGVNRLLNRRRMGDVRADDGEPDLNQIVASAQRTGRGAPLNVIASFPAFVFNEATKSQTPLANVPQEDLQCCICLGDYESDDKLRILFCKHSFHIACIDQWLKMNRHCPLCKQDVIMMHVEHASLVDAGEVDEFALGPDVVRVSMDDTDATTSAAMSAHTHVPQSPTAVAGQGFAVPVPRAPSPLASAGIEMTPVPSRAARRAPRPSPRRAHGNTVDSGPTEGTMIAFTNPIHDRSGDSPRSPAVTAASHPARLLRQIPSLQVPQDASDDVTANSNGEVIVESRSESSSRSHSARSTVRASSPLDTARSMRATPPGAIPIEEQELPNLHEANVPSLRSDLQEVPPSRPQHAPPGPPPGPPPRPAASRGGLQYYRTRRS